MDLALPVILHPLPSTSLLSMPQGHTNVALEDSDIKKQRLYTMRPGEGGDCFYYQLLVLSKRHAVLGIFAGPRLCCDLAGGPAGVSSKPDSPAYLEILWVIQHYCNKSSFCLI